MTTENRRGHPVRRRDVIKSGAALVGGAALPGALASQASAATSSTLVIAAPATPQSLDSNFDVSLGTIEAIAALYDNLLEFKKIPDPEACPAPSARTSPTIRTCPAGLAVQGKLAQSFELDPAGKFIRFQLRQGVKSNWGNELTADDVKWTWDRKFGLKRDRRLLSVDAWPGTSRGRQSRGQVHGLDQSRQSEPAAGQAAAQPLHADLRLDEVQGGGDRRRPVGAQIHREQLGRLRSLSPRSAATRPAGGVQGAARLLSRQAGDGHGDLPRGADLGHPRVAAAGRRGRHRAVSAAAGDHQTARRRRASPSTVSTPRS